METSVKTPILKDLELGIKTSIEKDVENGINMGVKIGKETKKKCFSLLFLLKIMGLEPIFVFDPFPNFRDKRHYKLKTF